MAIQQRDARANGREPLREQFRRGTDEFREVREEASTLIDDLRVLAEKELELARTEMSEQLGLSRQSAMFAGIAAVAAGLTLTFVALTLMFVLDTFMPLWVAALITTLALAAVTGFAAYMVREKIRRITVVPKKTIESVEEDVRWARRQLNFNAR